METQPHYLLTLEFDSWKQYKCRISAGFCVGLESESKKNAKPILESGIRIFKNDPHES